MLLSQPNFYRGQIIKFVRLWVHEVVRIFSDRLINEDDIKALNDMIHASVKTLVEDDEQEEVFAVPLLFTSFITLAGGNEKSYLPVKDNQQIKSVLETKLVEYNESGAAQMNLVLFDMAIEHVCKIVRIIDKPCGNALLIGVGGSGKQSLSKLASFIVEIEVVQLLVSSK